MLDFNKIKCDSKEKAKKILESGYNQEAFIVYSLIELMGKCKEIDHCEEKRSYSIKEPLEIKGNTEFEQIINKMSAEKFVGVVSIMADFAETIKIMNNNAYQLMMIKLKELI